MGIMDSFIIANVPVTKPEKSSLSERDFTVFEQPLEQEQIE